jgi:signal peptide peptidase SppA
VHQEPNADHDHIIIKRKEIKPLYAYADSFASMGDPGNKDYYLASIFTHIHLQQRGDLNLFGLLSETVFIRDLLEKYGIGLHVFKHGEFKNFPNMFTEMSMTKAHRENVTNIMNGINADVCTDITRSRSKALLASWLEKRSEDELWKRIHQSGTFPAVTAWKAGLVDFIPRRDPMRALLENNSPIEQVKELFSEIKGEMKLEELIAQSNQDEATKRRWTKKVEKKGQDLTSEPATKDGWKNNETDFRKFKAEEAISIEDYAKQVNKNQKAVARLTKRKAYLATYLAKHPHLAGLLSSAGMDVPSGYTDDKVALLYVGGGIGNETALKTVNAIRKISQDKNTKAVVVRVSSPGGSIDSCETIAEELKALKVPVVVSFGHVAASGGYYISAASNRIFASHKTITGSIGVFGIRADLTGLASKYGVKVQHVPSGDYSAMYSPFYPMSHKMKKSISGTIDRCYDQFKGVVASGRGLSLEHVEKIAQGRVWTGDQAKSNGLVDEIGGLNRAIAYARREFTASEEAEVVVWPKEQSLLERLYEANNKGGAALLVGILWAWACGGELKEGSSPVEDGFVGQLVQSFPNGVPANISGVFLAADENAAFRCLLESALERKRKDSLRLPEFFWD